MFKDSVMKKGYNYFTFKFTCENGHLKVVKYL